MFFPIGDRNTAETFPVVTGVLVAVNFFVFAAFIILVWFDHVLAEHYMRLAFVPADLLKAQGFATIITGLFLHAGPLHLLGNMLFLWTFGHNIEDALGHVRFLLFYLAAGVAATALHFIIDPMSDVPLLGASGAVSGVLGAYYVGFPHQRINIVLLVFPMRIAAVTLIYVWVLYQLTLGISSMIYGQSDVAYWAHIGGFAFGLLVFRYLKSRGMTDPYSERQRLDDENMSREDVVDIRELRKGRERR